MRKSSVSWGCSYLYFLLSLVFWVVYTYFTPCAVNDSYLVLVPIHNELLGLREKIGKTNVLSCREVPNYLDIVVYYLLQAFISPN